MEENERDKNCLQVMDPPPPKNSNVVLFTVVLSFLSAIGGFLFGYDTGVVSGTLVMIKPVFGMSFIMEEVFVSITMAAAMAFSLVAGVANNQFGRKATIIFASLTFLVGSVVLSVSYSITSLLVGRFIVGIGIGLTSMSSPMYLAECSNRLVRGRMVTLFNLFTILGQFVSLVVCAIFFKQDDGWRYVLGLAGVPAFLQFVFFIFMPESPRWLVFKNRTDEARNVLRKVNGIGNSQFRLDKIGKLKEADVEEELNLIQKDVEENQKPASFFKLLLKIFGTEHVKRALIIGASLQLIQQLSGINTVMYYSSSIIQMSGVSNISNILWISSCVLGVTFFAANLGLYLVDKIGRRPLTLFSLFGSMAGLLILGSGFLLSATNSPHVSLNTTFSICSTYETCAACVKSTSCSFCSQRNGEDISFCTFYNHSSINQHFVNFTKPDEHCLETYSKFKPKNNSVNLLSTLNDSFYNWDMMIDYCKTSYSWIATAGMMFYLVMFSIGMGPMPWTINSEIYPSWARSICVSIATGVNWFSNFVVSLTFLSLVEAITAYGAFYLYFSICLVSFIVLFLVLPETKNKPLEEIEELFKGDVIVATSKNKLLCSIKKTDSSNDYQKM